MHEAHLSILVLQGEADMRAKGTVVFCRDPDDITALEP